MKSIRKQKGRTRLQGLTSTEMPRALGPIVTVPTFTRKSQYCPNILKWPNYSQAAITAGKM
ncbi:hypothetical protein A6R68_05824 [Neotoma lepida]|uniref:Uncharacterized protein n=1 Tax=Neotoma lepida TaxID=56216 RepID=A0A1A6GHB1_NEOLE|nr:hypothetical protein A6R68_05824 [Neotoma lepida]